MPLPASAPCDQPRSCKPLAAAGQRTEVACPGAAYIYSRDELRRLFDPATVEISRRGAVQLEAVTFRTLLVLLYGAGLRFSEATSRAGGCRSAGSCSDHTRHEVL